MQVCMDYLIWKRIFSLGWDKFLQLLDFFQIENFYSLSKISLFNLFFNNKSAHTILIMNKVIVAVLGKFIENIISKDSDTTTTLKI